MTSSMVMGSVLWMGGVGDGKKWTSGGSQGKGGPSTLRDKPVGLEMIDPPMEQ